MTEFQKMKTSVEKVTEEWLFTVFQYMGKEEASNEIIQ